MFKVSKVWLLCSECVRLDLVFFESRPFHTSPPLQELPLTYKHVEVFVILNTLQMHAAKLPMKSESHSASTNSQSNLLKLPPIL